MPETSLRQISTHNCQTPKLPTALKRAASFTGCGWGHQGERECAAEDRNVASVTGRPCWSSLSPLSLGPSDLWAPSPAPTAPKISSLAPSHSALPPPTPPPPPPACRPLSAKPQLSSLLSAAICHFSGPPTTQGFQTLCSLQIRCQTGSPATAPLPVLVCAQDKGNR